MMFEVVKELLQTTISFKQLERDHMMHELYFMHLFTIMIANKRKHVFASLTILLKSNQIHIVQVLFIQFNRKLNCFI